MSTFACLPAVLRASLLSGAVCAAMAFATAVPALALDDGQESIFTTLGGLVGIGNKPRDEIDYRERPPLVLPPKMELRKPQTAASARNPAWPLDPDAEARRKAEDEAKLPIVFFGAKEAGARTSREELLRGRIANQPVPTPAKDNCSETGKGCTRWNPNEGGTLAATPDKVLAGEEPSRGTLTDPPKGYRLATKTVKATNEGPQAAEDNSARSFYKKRPKTDE